MPQNLKLQYQISWSLAREFGHLWASRESAMLIEHVTETGDGIAHLAEKINVLNEPLMDENFGGITGPVMTTDEYLVHYSGTGRLAWAIDQTGAVEITVSRPGVMGTVARAVIAPGQLGNLSLNAEATPIEGYEIKTGCLLRHLQILAQAAAAVVWASHRFNEGIAEPFVLSQAVIDDPED